MKQEQEWSAAAEQLLLSFKLLHCSSWVTHVLLKCPSRAQWWYCSICVHVLSRLLMLSASKGSPYAAMTHVSAQCTQSINWSALLTSLLTLICTPAWMHFHARHLQSVGATSVKNMGGEMYRMYTGYCFSGTPGQMDEQCFAGWCGSLGPVNNSPLLLSNLSHCENEDVAWETRSGVQIFFLSLTCGFLFQYSVTNSSGLMCFNTLQPLPYWHVVMREVL